MLNDHRYLLTMLEVRTFSVLLESEQVGLIDSAGEVPQLASLKLGLPNYRLTMTVLFVLGVSRLTGSSHPYIRSSGLTKPPQAAIPLPEIVY